MDQPANELVARARQGDRTALDALLSRHLPGLRAYLRLHGGALVRAKESASDLAQSVCREVLEEIGTLRGEHESAFRSWLYTMALRKVLDRKKYYTAHKRDSSRERPGEGPEADTGEARDLLDAYGVLCTPSREAMAREEVARIERAFDQLPEEFREVITLARILGLSHQEIGKRLGKSEDAVRQMLHRARARLALLLG